MMDEAEIDKKRKNLQDKANSGSVSAMAILDKMDRDELLAAKKKELMDGALFGRPEHLSDVVSELPTLPTIKGIPALLKDLDITEIENYIRRGEFKSLPEHMLVYLKWMEMAHDWYYKFKDKNWIIKFLIANCKDASGDNISYYLATKVFTDMLSFFYSDADFKRNSWFMYLAERVMMGAALAWELNDIGQYNDCVKTASDIIQKITIEKQNVDKRLLERRARYFLTDSAQLGVGKIDRNALARSIDEMVIPEKVKLRLKQDLGTVKRDMGEDTLGAELEETK